MTIPQIITGLLGCCIGYMLFGIGTAALMWAAKSVLEVKQWPKGGT